jgi:PAS domain S-box-containing protein
MIDDSEPRRYALGRTLRQAGFRIEQAGGGQAGLEAAQRQPDVILLDVQFPGACGLELCRKLKANPETAHIPIIQISSAVQDRERREGPELVADDYLLEPISNEELVAKVGAWVRVRRSQADVQLPANAVLANEQSYRLLFETMLEGVAHCKMLFDAEGRPCDFVYLDVNSAFARLTGLHNVIGRRVTEVIPGIRESNPELFEIYGRVALTGRPEKFETELENLGMLLSISVYSTQKDHFVAVFDNITERRRAEKVVRDGQEWLRVTLTSIGDAVVTSDAESRITFLNPVAEALTEWKTEEAIGQPVDTVFRIVSEETGEPTASIVEVALRERRTVALANHSALVTKSGRQIPIEDSAAPIRDTQGNVVGVVVVFHDVAERRHAQQALRRSEERLRVAALGAEIGVWYWTPGTSYVEVSANWRRLFGVPPEVEVTFHTWREALHPADRERALRELNAASEERREFDVEYRALWPDGTIRWIVDRGRAWYDENGRPVGMAGINVDITDRKQAEEAVASAALFPAENPNPVLRLKADGELLYKNGPARALLVAEGWKDSHPAPEALREMAEAALRSGSSQLRDVRCTDGRVVSFHCSPQAAKAYANFYGRDVTAERQADQQLQKLNRTLKALNNSNQALLRATNEAELLEDICKIITQDCGYAMVWIGYAEHDENKTVRPVAHAGFEEGYLETLGITWADTEHGRGPTGAAIRTGETRMCRNMLTDPAYAPWRNQALQRGYASSLVLPLIAEGKAFGAINVYSREPEAFCEDEVKLLEELAGDLAYGISALRLRIAHAQVEQALRQSEQRVRLKLESILSPEADLGDLQLADIIDAPALQSMMEELHKFTGIPMAIIDLEGKVLVGVGWQDICTKFHRVNPESCKHCVESDVELSRGVPPGEYRLYRCKNNMWDVATPITVGGEHVGNVFTGQFFFEGETLDLELFRGQARRFGFDEASYLAALDRVPRLSRSALAASMAYFMKLAEIISKLSYSNLKLARSLAERDALTESLRSNQAHLRMALDAAKSGTWEWDVQTGLVACSDEVSELLGLEPNQRELCFDIWLAAVHPEDRDLALRAVRDAARNGTEINLEYRVEAGGRLRWLMARGRPVRDAEGHPLRFVGIIMDVTERKRAEAALIRTEKLASVGRMAATIAHEINNPLAAVVNILYLARTHKAEVPAPVRGYLDLADEELRRIAHITRQVLGFYREAASPTSVAVSAVLDSATDLLQGKIRAKGVIIEKQCDDDPCVRGIAGELRQVFCNLLSNSIEAVSANGTIKLRVSRSRNFINGQWYVRVTVADNGKGIDPSVRPHIFEPFFTTKGTIGTGLGLWVSKQIVEKHGGTIRVRSRAQQQQSGTAFSIVLPADGAGAARGAAAAAAATSALRSEA